MTINELRAAGEAYNAACKAAEMPGGVFDPFHKTPVPTPEEYAGHQIIRCGSPEAALAAMQAEGRDVYGDMDSVARRTAAIIAAAIAKSR